MVKACESAEDNYEQEREDLKQLGLRGRMFWHYRKWQHEICTEVVMQTRWCIHWVVCNELPASRKQSTIAQVGPEVIAGSTRMKAASAQKLVLTTINRSNGVYWKNV